ncbi:unnamed protein product [Gemmata massiliana]|uniref:Uncharacterized protein n=1 Tax=Gemmata massiliana TaxID=1210884 RepID=A0A6P2D3H8_9BACT|nr:unnamed protein product [Gemmata massiliana]
MYLLGFSYIQVRRGMRLPNPLVKNRTVGTAPTYKGIEVIFRDTSTPNESEDTLVTESGLTSCGGVP